MKTKVAGSKNCRIILDDRSEFFYVISPFEITNALGVILAVLDEYFITNKGGDVFKLYKTNEGNWFDFPGINASDNSTFLRQLKVALDNQTFSKNCK